MNTQYSTGPGISLFGVFDTCRAKLYASLTSIQQTREPVSFLSQAGMRCNSFIIFDYTRGEGGKRSYSRIVTDLAVMQNCVRPYGAVFTDAGIA